MKPVVSVCCITYNHDRYIRQCIEGFLKQKTNFSIEILIFDDASTDKTQEIINEYASLNPYISTFLQSENQWKFKRYGLIDWLFPAARGKYIAICEGDDYWTDPLKLQKQVDFLEENEGYVCVGGKVRIIDTRNESNKLQYWQQYFEYTGNQAVPKDNILDKVKLPFHTSTFLFKRDALDLKSFKLLFKHSISGDIPLLNIFNSKGSIAYLGEDFGVKNYNKFGITVTQEHRGLNFLWNRVYMWKQIAKLYSDEYLKIIAIKNNQYFHRLFSKKFQNLSISDQIDFFKNAQINKKDLLLIFFITSFRKIIIKFN